MYLFLVSRSLELCAQPTLSDFLKSFLRRPMRSRTKTKGSTSYLFLNKKMFGDLKKGSQKLSSFMITVIAFFFDSFLNRVNNGDHQIPLYRTLKKKQVGYASTALMSSMFLMTSTWTIEVVSQNSKTDSDVKRSFWVNFFLSCITISRHLSITS